MSGAKDPKVREAACMVRALKACCQVPGQLPSQAVLRVAAWQLCLDLPDVLRRRDRKHLAAATGLKPEYIAALLRSFPDSMAVHRLKCGVGLMLDGLAPRLVPAALERWNTEAPDRLARDPYSAVHEIKGTVEEADAFAKPAFADRVVGHARWALLSAKKEGHTMLPTRQVVKKLAWSQGPGVDVDAIRQALADGVSAGGKLAVVGPPDDEEGIADPDVFRDEAMVATEVKKRLAPGHVMQLDMSDHAFLTESQIEAVKVVCAAGISVLTGGPGTGKSTVVRALVQAVGEDTCLLTAPTGRAARNVGGNTVHSASGGRLLKRRPLQEIDRTDVPTDLRLLVVDEASMLTTELMLGVLNLAPPGCHVVLVGDADQLPPVGTGNVFVDLLASGVVPVSRLTHNHRSQGHVQRLAAAVLAGDVSTFDFGDVLVDVQTTRDAVRAAVQEVVRCGAQVLTPINAARAVLNRAVQSAMRDVPFVTRVEVAGVPAGCQGTFKTSEGVTTLTFQGSRPQLQLPVDSALSVTRTPTGTELLLPGDLVMALKNQNKRTKPGEISACNGDIGSLLRRTAAGKPVVQFADGVSEFASDDWLTLAYVATVHKFQGSECDVVVIPLAQSAALWDRQLLYTAITRARERVVLLGTRQDVQTAASRCRPARHSALRRLLLS